MKKTNPGCLWTFVVFAAVVFLSQYLGSEPFEKLFHPEEYWNDRVITLQGKVNTLQLYIVEVSGDLNKNASVELRTVLSRKFFGLI